MQLLRCSRSLQEHCRAGCIKLLNPLNTSDEVLFLITKNPKVEVTKFNNEVHINLIDYIFFLTFSKDADHLDVVLTSVL